MMYKSYKFIYKIGKNAFLKAKYVIIFFTAEINLSLCLK